MAKLYSYNLTSLVDDDIDDWSDNPKKIAMLHDWYASNGIRGLCITRYPLVKGEGGVYHDDTTRPERLTLAEFRHTLEVR